MTLAVVIVGGAATACSHSGVTQPTTTGGQPPQNSRLVDTFAYNVIVDTNWTISVGNVATYLILADGVNKSGVPTPIGPRLLTDTITVNDTLGGPPSGTDLETPSYLTFDASGNLWMSVAGSHGDGSVVEYSRAQTSQNGSPIPSPILTGTRTPQGLKFDAKGRLWVVDSSATAVYGYSSVQVVTGGGPAADTMSTAGITTAGVTWAPADLTIDAQGDLWVSAVPRGAGSGSVPFCVIAEFSASSLQSSGTPTPTLILTGPNGVGVGPAMTFDSSGDLWTANPAMGTLTEFSAASLTPGSNPAPTITISGIAGGGDIAIDADGFLYVGGTPFGPSGPGIVAYRASQLTTSGSPTPVLNFAPSTGVFHFAFK